MNIPCLNQSFYTLSMFISSTQNGIFINNLGRGEVTKLQYIVYNYLKHANTI